MSLRFATYEEAKAAFKPMKRPPMRRRSSAIPYGSNSLGARKKKTKRAKKATDKQLKKRLWREFSIFIRTFYADENGYVQCVTCLAIHLWNSGQIQAGHWIHNRLDFDRRNIHPQCTKCNYHWNTQVNIAYAVFMAKTYGVEIMDELRLLAHTKGNRYLRTELEEMLVEYRALNNANPLVERKAKRSPRADGEGRGATRAVA